MTMAEEKFLAFKGLKQYDPSMGWASVHNFAEPPAPSSPSEVQANEDNFATESSQAQDRKSTRLNSSHIPLSRMPSSA